MSTKYYSVIIKRSVGEVSTQVEAYTTDPNVSLYELSGAAVAAVTDLDTEVTRQQYELDFSLLSENKPVGVYGEK